jgi:Protein of unknown function (DUF3180)
MRPTRVGTLVLVALVVGALAWAALRVMESRSGGLPEIPLTAPGTIAFLAAILAGFALSIRSRLRARRERRPDARPVDPLLAARLVVTAKASALVGAGLTGAYAGFLVVLLVELGTNDRRGLLLRAGVCVVAGIVLVVAALALERACRVPGGDDPAERGGTPPAVRA